MTRRGITSRLALACAILGAMACGGGAPAPGIVPLEGSLAPVRDAFNAAADRTRVVALLSPT